MSPRRIAAASALLVSLVSLAPGHAGPDDARRRKQRPPPAAAAPTPAPPAGRGDKARPLRPDEVKVTIEAAADAPRPPTDRMKKTQPVELSKLPAKREIKSVEDKIYSLERDRAMIWAYLDDPQGARARDVGFIARELEELTAAVAALRAAAPDWKRLAEYDQRVGYLVRAQRAHAAHYAAIAGARDQAVATAEAEADAAWQAKRVTDDGVKGELHTKAVGKVVFARTAFTATTASAATAGELDVTGPLFVRAFVAESPWNLMHGQGVDCGRVPQLETYWYETTVTVNGGGRFVLENRTVDRAMFQSRTALDLTELGNLTAGGTFANADERKAGFGWIAKVVPDLKPGRNTVDFAVTVGCYGAHGDRPVVASGQLVVTATAAAQAEVFARGIGPLIASEHPAAALAKYRDKLVKHYAADYEMLEFRSAGEWQPRRNELGVVLTREMPTIALLRKRTGVGCVLMSLVLSEPFDGRSYGPALNLAGEFARPFVCRIK